MERHVIGLLEKIQRPPEYPEMLRLEMSFQVLAGVPFSKKAELIFILNTLAKIVTFAPALHPYGDNQ
jgi:hypothetical protein